MLKPGGMMVYSTCTFSPLENEQSIEYLLSLDDRMEIVDFPKYELFDDGHPEWGNTDNEDLRRCARLWPHRLKGEGHFVTLLKKNDTDDSSYSYSRSYSYCASYNIKNARLDKETMDFLSGINRDFDYSRFEIDNNRLYYIPDTFPDTSGLRLLRTGLYVGDIKKNRFEPSQSLAMNLRKDEYNNVIDLDIEDERVLKYLKCETIEAEGDDGWALVCVSGYPLGWGKLKNNVLKNKYLTGWRLMS